MKCYHNHLTSSLHITRLIQYIIYNIILKIKKKKNTTLNINIDKTKTKKRK
jgi:hypothetical protein